MQQRPQRWQKVNHRARDPGGVVPWHTNDQRAATIMIAEGSITEHSSTCSVPIEHPAGEAIAEYGPNRAHWWRNNSDKTVVIIAGDLLPPKMGMAPGQMERVGRTIGSG